MKIAFVTNAFSENTGYLTNCLPKALAKLGHEVHLIAPNVQVYFNSPNYKETYEAFLGPPIVEVESKMIDGFHLHRLQHGIIKNEQYFKKGLRKKLKEIQPDVVQVFHVESIIAWQVLFAKMFLKFKLFSANHTLRSVFPLADQWPNLSPWKKLGWNLKHKLPGKVIGLFVKKYFCQTIDAGEIAVDYYGAQKEKILVEPLAVDTDLFLPDLKRKTDLKLELGFSENDKICVYTGRFSEGKSPLILAKAINHLSSERPDIKGLFIGNGIQEDEIKGLKNCSVNPFVRFNELPKFYQASDIGVWPREESTSMLDAMASGLPLIISDTVTTMERVDGNGLLYRENDHLNLAQKILEILSDPENYRQMSKFGVEKAQRDFSWDAFATKRLAVYEER